MNETSWSPARVADRMQIQEQLSRYGRAVDRIQIGALAAVFHDDAVIVNGSVETPVADFLANVGRRHPGVPVGSHFTGNVVIDFIGPDTAFVESYSLAFEQHPPVGGEGPVIDRLARVRNADVFERRDGVWRIARRMGVRDHVTFHLVNPQQLDPLTGKVFDPASLTQRRSAEDPILVFRASLGLPV